MNVLFFFCHGSSKLWHRRCYDRGVYLKVMLYQWCNWSDAVEKNTGWCVVYFCHQLPLAKTSETECQESVKAVVRSSSLLLSILFTQNCEVNVGVADLCVYVNLTSAVSCSFHHTNLILSLWNLSGRVVNIHVFHEMWLVVKFRLQATLLTRL